MLSGSKANYKIFSLWCTNGGFEPILKTYKVIGPTKKCSRSCSPDFLFLFLYLEGFSIFGYHMVKPVRSCVTFNFTNHWRKRHKMFLRKFSEHEH